MREVTTGRILLTNNVRKGNFGEMNTDVDMIFEAAKVVKIAGIDDSSFRDNAYYPKDMLG